MGYSRRSAGAWAIRYHQLATSFERNPMLPITFGFSSRRAAENFRFKLFDFRKALAGDPPSLSAYPNFLVCVITRPACPPGANGPWTFEMRSRDLLPGEEEDVFKAAFASRKGLDEEYKVNTPVTTATEKKGLFIDRGPEKMEAILAHMFKVDVAAGFRKAEDSTTPALTPAGPGQTPLATGRAGNDAPAPTPPPTLTPDTIKPSDLLAPGATLPTDEEITRLIEEEFAFRRDNTPRDSEGPADSPTPNPIRNPSDT